MKRVLVDTGPIVAILSSHDEHHRRCTEALRTMPGPLFTCWPVITEAAWLLRRDQRTVQRLLHGIESGFLEILALSAASAAPIGAIMKEYADMEIQLADAALVHLAVVHALDTVFTLDRRDFSVFRLPKGKLFRILP